MQMPNQVEIYFPCVNLFTMPVKKININAFQFNKLKKQIYGIQIAWGIEDIPQLE